MGSAARRHHRRWLDRTSARAGFGRDGRCRAGRHLRYRSRARGGDRPPRGARAYERWEEMLEREKLDAVWVCTPPLHHRAPTVAALAGGVHVYLEKPIARTLDDAEAIVSGARSADAVCAVGYQLARQRAPRRDAPGVGRPASSVARGPELRTGGREALVHGPCPGRRPNPRARQPPHRSSARNRRGDLCRAGCRRERAPGAGGCGGLDRRRDRLAVPLRKRSTWLGVLSVVARRPAGALCD
jgi:hypothetical protein